MLFWVGGGVLSWGGIVGGRSAVLGGLHDTGTLEADPTPVGDGQGGGIVVGGSGVRTA